MMKLMIKDSTNLPYDDDIVVKNQNVKMSDDKLYRIQLRTYELAEVNCNKLGPSKLLPVCVSVAATLFLTLLTSDFKQIGCVSSEEVKIIVICLDVIFGLLSAILLIITRNSSDTAHIQERENAIEEAKRYVIDNQCTPLVKADSSKKA